MDRNTTIGFILIAAILVGYGYFSRPTDEEIAQQKIELLKADSLQQVKLEQEAALKVQEVTTIAADTAPSIIQFDSVQVAAKQMVLEQQFGVFAPAAEGTEETLVVENDLFTITFSNKGAIVNDVVLKDYKTYEQLPLHLFDPKQAVQDLILDVNGKTIHTQDLFFVLSSVPTKSITGDATTKVQYVAATNIPNVNLTVDYLIRGNDYMVDYNIQKNGLDRILQKPISLNWKNTAFANEKNPEMEKQRCSVFYTYMGDDRDYLSERSDDEEVLSDKLSWVAFKQNFFSSILIAPSGMGGENKGQLNILPLEDSLYTKAYSATFTLENEASNSNINLQWFFGPNHYQTLKNYEIAELDRIIDFGWGIFGWVNKYFIVWIFYWLQNLNIGYGVIIIILTVLIKLILFPLTYKNYVSSARMRVLKPEIDAINEKHKNSDAMKKQQATMALYKQAGVNPMAGCLPMVVQMPILYAMFRFFPASIELRQQSFLWADDLSSYDSIAQLPFEIPFYGDHVSLFTLLMTASTFVYTAMNSSNVMQQQQPGMPNMKVIMYLFPVMMLFFFNSYSSGLSFYYFLANLMTISQMFIIKKYIVNDDKIKAKIESNKTNNKGAKKGRFQAKLEEMAKQKGAKS